MPKKVRRRWLLRFGGLGKPALEAWGAANLFHQGAEGDGRPRASLPRR
jgi:hypothetical protein